jgi:hypothetical protein
VLETADELGRLEREEICEIIKFVMVENQSKEDRGTVVVSKPKEKSMTPSNPTPTNNNK